MLARALEVLKSWTYFERLSEQRAESSPNARVEPVAGRVETGAEDGEGEGEGAGEAGSSHEAQ